MKQFTTSKQTSKLIELGIPKPKGWCAEGISSRLIMYKHKEDNESFNYSIGELIEIINQIDDEELRIFRSDNFWNTSTDFYASTNRELVDALYDMIVVLKENVVI